MTAPSPLRLDVLLDLFTGQNKLEKLNHKIPFKKNQTVHFNKL